jgi:hypothetical protein
MFHKECGDFLLFQNVHDPQNLHELILGHAGRWLVQQQERGFQGERPRYLQGAPLSVGETGRQLPRILLQAEEGEQLHGFVELRLLFALQLGGLQARLRAPKRS